MFHPHGAQSEALRRSEGRRGFAFFMEMGLGKTMTTLYEFHRLAYERKATRLVVICPNSFKRGWKADAEKWGMNLDFFIWEAGSEKAVSDWMRTQFKCPPVLVVNYEAVRSDKVQAIIDRFIHAKPAYLAIDESIKLKNPKSAQTKAIISMCDKFEVVRVLSGKPQTQGPHDLWAQLRAIGANKGMNYYSFKTLFCRMGGYMSKQVVGSQNEQWLQNMMDGHTFVATKADYAKELPEKTYTIREYTQNPEVAAHYASMERDFLTYLESEAITVDMAITKYMKMAQIQAGFIIDENGKTTDLVDPSENARVLALRDILEDEVTSKVCVVYKHRHSLDLLRDALHDYWPAHIAGGMAGHEVEDMKSRFNTDPKCRVILLQVSAAKYGHTLLGGDGDDACNTMVFFENSYSLDDRSQIEDRIHRHGQKNTCLYIDLSGTQLDTRVISALQRKEALYQAVFDKMRSFPVGE